MAYLTIEEEQNKIRKKFMDDSNHLVRLEHIDENGLYGEKTVINTFDYGKKIDNVSIPYRPVNQHEMNKNETHYVVSESNNYLFSESQHVWNTSMKGIEPAFEPYLYQDINDAEKDFVKLKSEFYGIHSDANINIDNNQDFYAKKDGSELEYINSGMEIPIGGNPVFSVPGKVSVVSNNNFETEKNREDYTNEYTEEYIDRHIEHVPSEPMTFQDVLEMSEKSGVQNGIKNSLNDDINLNPDLFVAEDHEPKIESLNENLSYDVFPENIIDESKAFNVWNPPDESTYEEVEVIPIVSTISNGYVTEGLGIDDSEENREHLKDLFYEKYPAADEIQFGDREPVSNEIFASFEEQHAEIPPIENRSESYEEVILSSGQQEMNNSVDAVSTMNIVDEDSVEEDYEYFEQDQLPYFEVEEPTLIEPDSYISDEDPYITESESFDSNNYNLNTAYVEQDYVSEEDQSYIEDIPLQEEEEPKKKNRLFVPILLLIILLVLLLAAIVLLLLIKKTGFTFHFGINNQLPEAATRIQALFSVGHAL